jgi:hypothetical protein
MVAERSSAASIAIVPAETVAMSFGEFSDASDAFASSGTDGGELDSSATQALAVISASKEPDDFEPEDGAADRPPDCGPDDAGPDNSDDKFISDLRYS